MSIVNNNSLISVQTYHLAGYPRLQNMYCAFTASNLDCLRFPDFPANLGDTVLLNIPTRLTYAQGLIPTFQSINQNYQPLVIDQSINTAVVLSNQQIVENDPEKFMSDWGGAAIEAIGNAVEINVLNNAITNTFRFAGDGYTQFVTSNQFATAMAALRDFGAPSTSYVSIIDNVVESNVIGNNINQITVRRNDEEAESWRIGRFGNCEFMRSNLLQVHYAGDEGNAGQDHYLTVVSTTVNAQNQITAITVNGASSNSNPNAIKKYDKMQIADTSARFLNYITFTPTQQPIQFRADADCASDSSGNITIPIYPYLNTAQDVSSQNVIGISTPITAGMQIKVVPTHRAGLLMAGKPLMLAMPPMPPSTPYPGANEKDPETGMAYRMYHGLIIEAAQYGMVYDCIWGSTLVPTMAMSYIFPY